MIRPIDIRLNAAHPELPLAEAVTFTGSPSTVLIRGVPPNCGRWAITAVFVAASFPDGSTTTRAAVQSANGVWVATLPATATSGRTANGIRIMADGVDENGEAVTGYILGVADFAVASLSVAPAPEPGETSYQMLYFDEVPSTLRKGDVAKIDGVLKFYNGTAWEPFAAPITLDDAVTRASANGVTSSGIWRALWGALASLPTGFSSLYDWVVNQLAGKLDKSGGTMTGALVVDSTVPETTTGIQIGSSSSDIYKWTLKKDSASKDFIFWMLGEWTLVRLRNMAGTIALTSDIPSVPVKAVKVDGTALTPDGNGAVDITGKADRAHDPTAGNLAALDSDGNPTDSTISAVNVATKGEIPYILVTKTISNGAVTLDDRAINAVAVSSSLASLTVNFPTATSGKARDFGLRLTVASGITTAPQIVLPQGVTCENADGEAPEIGADGAATILYFTETASGVFLVKSETLAAITQA